MKQRSKNLVLLGLIGTLLNPVGASSPHAGQQQGWTTTKLHSVLASMPQGDAARGEERHNALFCASCHGVRGEAPSMNWPTLVGQRMQYTYKILLDYKSGLRNEDARSEVMTLSAQHLSEQDMADLAAFYAAQPLPEASRKSTDAALTLIEQGDPTRLITPCASCHGLDGQGGKNESPAIAGQTRRYFERTMKLYHGEQRNNDNDYAMRAFAMPLTDEEIAQLAAYFAPAGE